MKTFFEIILSQGWRQYLTFDKIRYRLMKHCSFGRKSFYSYTAKFAGNNMLGDNTAIDKVDLGYGSYISDGSTIKSARIGKYTSIGQRVSTINGNHMMNGVSLHPSFYSENGYNGISYNVQKEHKEYKMAIGGQYSVEIGNDVWIGADSHIMEGVSIGDGAIIGAGALVTHDVPPYEIWVGVPARKKGVRFPNEKIAFLEELKWWNFSEEKMRKYAPFFGDIDLLMEKCGEEGK